MLIIECPLFCVLSVSVYFIYCYDSTLDFIIISTYFHGLSVCLSPRFSFPLSILEFCNTISKDNNLKEKGTKD